MPVNQYNEQKACFQRLDKLLTKQLPKEGIHINELLRQALTGYAVSRGAVLEFVEECYVKTGLIIKEEEILYKKEIK